MRTWGTSLGRARERPPKVFPNYKMTSPQNAIKSINTRSERSADESSTDCVSSTLTHCTLDSK